MRPVWVLGVALILSAGHLYAETAAPPPEASADTWIALSRYLPGEGDHNFLYGAGSRVRVAGPLELSARMYFLSAEVPGSPLAFDASAFFSDLRPEMLVGDFVVFGRHSCKHDLDQQRRLVILQTVGVGWERRFGEVAVSSDVEAALPSLLPGQDTEAYRGGASLSAMAPLLMWPSAFVFAAARVRASLLWGNGPEAGFDYQVDLGLRWALGLVYVRMERQADPWITPDGPPLDLWSLTVSLGRAD